MGARSEGVGLCACALFAACAGGAGTGGGAPNGSKATPGQPNAGGNVAVTSAAVNCEGVVSKGARMLRRLSRYEYDNSVKDLLGLDADAESNLAADTVVNGFDNNAGVLTVTPLLGSQLYDLADKLAGQALQNLATLAPCASAQNPGADCVQTLITEFGRRAFRRPLSAAEIARYTDLHAVGAADGGFSGGAQLVLTAMLQSPNFLYRRELGTRGADGSYTLDSHEIATELAYTMTGSTPDDALLQAADADQLKTPDQIETQAKRLQQTPRGQQQLVRFVDEWLAIDRLGSVPKDAQIFPEFTPEIRKAMADEVNRFVAYVGFESEGTLAELLTAQYGFVDQTLASFYHVSAPSTVGPDGFGKVPALDADRRGVLGLGGVLTTYGRPDSSSPVLRGKLVREQLLCQPLSPPPPGIIVQPPPVDPSLTVRERFAAHSQKEPCASCHQLIDPIGFGFEHFDGVGRYRERDGEHPVDASGQIMDSLNTNGSFDGVSGLVQMLAKSDEVARCFADQWFRFAYGIQEDDPTHCALDQIQRGFSASSGKLSELMLLATRTPLFRLRQAGPGDDTTVTSDPSSVPAQMPVSTAADAGAPAPTGGTPAMNSSLSVTVHTDSRWGSGHCDSVSVTNNGTMPLDWSTQLMLDGMLNDHWNSNVDGQSGLVTFTGADWNRTIKPGETAQFGYCVAT